MTKLSIHTSCLVRSANVVGIRELTLEGDHRVAAISLDNSRQKRNRSRHLVCRKESKDSKLGQPSVVDLRDQPTFFGFF